MSGNSEYLGSVIIGFPRDVGLIGGGPFVVDLDQDGGDEALQGGLVGKVPDPGAVVRHCLW